MKPVIRKTFDEKVLKIVCSQNLKIFACITESGKLFLLRTCLTICWTRSENKERIYDCCFSPNSKFLALLCSVDQVNYLKIIHIEDKRELFFQKIPHHAIISIWFNFKFLFDHSFDEDIIKITEENVSTEISENPVIGASPNLLAITYEDFMILYLQGMIPIFKVNNSAGSIGVCNGGKTFIYTNKSSSLCYVNLGDQVEHIKDGLHILKLIHILKPHITGISNWIDIYKHEFIKKPDALIRFLKIHSNKKPLKQEFCIIYFLGIISPELTHKIAEKSSKEMLTDSLQICEKMLKIYSETTKFQYLIEKCLSICELIKSCIDSNPRLSECHQLVSLIEKLYEFHSWSFRLTAAHYNSKTNTFWRIFITWLVYVHQYLNRTSDKGKFFDQPIFESLTDLGDDHTIRKILLEFILNDLEKIVTGGYKVFSEPAPDLESLRSKIEAFDHCIAEYLVLKSHIFPKSQIRSDPSQMSFFQNQNINFLQVIHSEKDFVTTFTAGYDQNTLSLTACMISTPFCVLLHQYFSDDKAILIVEVHDHVSVIVLTDLLWTKPESASVRTINSTDVKNQTTIENDSSFTILEYFNIDNSILGFDESNTLTLFNL